MALARRSPGYEAVFMALIGRKTSGWWKRRKSAPFSSASSKTSGSGVSATRTRLTSAAGSPTCRPQLSHSSARDNGAMRSTASAMCPTLAKVVGIVQSPDREPPQAGRTRLSGNPPSAPRRSSVPRGRGRGRRAAGPVVGGTLGVPDQRALAALPRLPHPFGEGQRPACDPTRRAGWSPVGRRGAARGGLRTPHPPRRTGGAQGSPSLLRAGHAWVRGAHVREQPVPSRGGRLRRRRLPCLRLRCVGSSRYLASAARVLGPTRAWPPHAPGACLGRPRRRRGNLDLLPPHHLIS